MLSQSQSVLLSPSSKSVVQSVIFDKDFYSLPEAVHWIKQHKDLVSRKVDETVNTFRFRQKNPETLKKNGYHFVTKKISIGISFVIAF